MRYNFRKIRTFEYLFERIIRITKRYARYCMLFETLRKKNTVLRMCIVKNYSKSKNQSKNLI